MLLTFQTIHRKTVMCISHKILCEILVKRFSTFSVWLLCIFFIVCSTWKFCVLNASISILLTHAYFYAILTTIKCFTYYNNIYTKNKHAQWKLHYTIYILSAKVFCLLSIPWTLRSLFSTITSSRQMSLLSSCTCVRMCFLYLNYCMSMTWMHSSYY